ncbi:MAG: hypothetical protein SGILL_006970 [Bacillariaceae sp.]
MTGEILGRVPGYLSEIDQALMGAGYGESMSLATMFEYYYSWEVLGLQLWVEAYHAAEDPEAFYPQIEGLYFDIWKPKVDAQLHEYMLRMPMANETKTIELSSGLDMVANMIVSKDEKQLYFVSYDTNKVSCTDTEGGDFKVTNRPYIINEGFYFSQSILFEYGDNIYSGGSEERPIFHLDEYSHNLEATGRGIEISEPHLYKLSTRGFDVAEDTLWVVLMQSHNEPRHDGPDLTPGDSSVVAVNLNDFSYDTCKSFTLPTYGKFTGPIKVIDRTSFAVVISSVAFAAGHDPEVMIVNLETQEMVEAFPGNQLHTWKHPDGNMEVYIRWADDFLAMYIDVVQLSESGNKTIEHHALAIPTELEYGAPKSVVSTGNIAYSAGYTAANYTIIENKEQIRIPMPDSTKGGSVTMAESGDLYRYVTPNKVIVSEYLYEAEFPPETFG